MIHQGPIGFFGSNGSEKACTCIVFEDMVYVVKQTASYSMKVCAFSFVAWRVMACARGGTGCVGVRRKGRSYMDAPTDGGKLAGERHEDGNYRPVTQPAHAANVLHHRRRQKMEVRERGTCSGCGRRSERLS